MLTKSIASFRCIAPAMAKVPKHCFAIWAHPDVCRLEIPDEYAVAMRVPKGKEQFLAIED